MSRRPRHAGPSPETWLHLYGQAAWHSEASIEGTREGLKALREAIDEALRTNRDGRSGFLYTGDGEGYRATVKILTAEQVREAPLPYVDDVARDPRLRGEA